VFRTGCSSRDHPARRTWSRIDDLQRVDPQRPSHLLQVVTAAARALGSDAARARRPTARATLPSRHRGALACHPGLHASTLGWAPDVKARRQPGPGPACASANRAGVSAFPRVTPTGPPGHSEDCPGRLRAPPRRPDANPRRALRADDRPWAAVGASRRRERRRPRWGAGPRRRGGRVAAGMRQGAAPGGAVGVGRELLPGPGAPTPVAQAAVGVVSWSRLVPGRWPRPGSGGAFHRSSGPA
jgi:hypothetical protein